MSELLLCYQGLENYQYPRYYGSWFELSVDMLSGEFVPDYIINEDTGHGVVTNPHLKFPSEVDTWYVVNISGWTMQRELGSAWGQAGEPAYEQHRAAVMNRRMRERTYTNVRFIAMQGGIVTCIVCEGRITSLNHATLLHSGARHKSDFCQVLRP